MALIVFGVIAVGVYYALLHFRDEVTATPAYRAFRYGFPVLTGVLLLALAGVLYTAGRFEPLRQVGISIDPLTIGSLSLWVSLLALLGVSGMTLWAGVASPRVEAGEPEESA